MNQLHNNQTAFGYWGFTGLAGAVSTTAVALLLSAVLSTPAHSAPRSYMPADPDAATVVSPEKSWDIGLCFMGRHNWNDAISGAPPTCRR